ncbi:glycosyltransferase [Pseudomonas sp. SK2]|uniref:glycosyltransferase family 4 protein n=1 Tax=Pseudomonas sp. SK2 TaxID=2841063 RepID=UPI00192A709E|nr:glycosyltransferase [Pseudomonas sp. SK2]QQZ37596.1 glycosyltransferase [Pseudomonas sp. SK2]
MRVLHIISGLNVGGAELMLRRLIESHLHLPQYEHIVISLTGQGVIGPQLQALGVKVFDLQMQGFKSTFFAIFRLFRLIRKYSPDIVQTWMYHADLLGGLAARAAGNQNIIWGIRTTDLERGGKLGTRLVRKVCASLSKMVPTRIVCAAEASKEIHIRIGYDAAKMLVIPNGFDITRLSASDEQRRRIREDLLLTDENLVIGSLGRFNPVKDQANFIDATSILARQYPKLRFLMVGRGLDKENEVLMRLISSTGYSERYLLLGERQDVAPCLKAMDIFCLHSQTEGFPNVLGEAMLVGVPCVSTDVGDASILLGGKGILVPPQNAVELSDGLDQMIKKSKDERKQLADDAKARVISEFSLSLASERFGKLYDTLVKRV